MRILGAWVADPPRLHWNVVYGVRWALMAGLLVGIAVDSGKMESAKASSDLARVSIDYSEKDAQDIPWLRT